ncbi:hypothetical protein [Herminiimonas sp. CN]|uniref:hypothetical protein n=1 Tax=Herminiimonas sp. CN TaxID=1349818 RepID=UPI000473502C|nr:hypothetical protein [Herminiimonas sp. CN]
MSTPESAEQAVVRILTETSYTRMPLTKLVSETGLPRKQVIATLRTLVEGQLVREISDTFNKFVYALVARDNLPVAPTTPLWWQKGELKGYETKIRAFMSACESSR